VLGNSDLWEDELLWLEGRRAAEACLFLRAVNQTRAPNRTKIPMPIGMPTPRPIFAPEGRPDIDGDAVADEADPLMVAEEAALVVEEAALVVEEAVLVVEEAALVDAVKVDDPSDDEVALVDKEVKPIVVCHTVVVAFT
jgi:hypothetical protein